MADGGGGHVWRIAALFAVLTMTLSWAVGALARQWGVAAWAASIVAQCAPLLAAGLTWGLFVTPLRSMAPPRAPRGQMTSHAILAGCAVVLFLAVDVTVFVFSGHDVMRGQVAVPFIVVLLGVLPGSVLSEMGYRGLLQPTLERRWPRVVSSLVTGVVWGVAQAPTLTDRLADALTLVALTVATSVLIGSLAVGSRHQRALLAGAMHWLLLSAGLFVSGTLATTSHVGPAVVAAIATAIVFGVLVAMTSSHWMTNPASAAATPMRDRERVG